MGFTNGILAKAFIIFVLAALAWIGYISYSRADEFCRDEFKKSWGIEYAEKNMPDAKSTEVTFVDQAQSLYETSMKWNNETPNKEFTDMINSAIVFSWEEMDIASLVYYDVHDCEIGYSRVLTMDEVKEILNLWAKTYGQEA